RRAGGKQRGGDEEGSDATHGESPGMTVAGESYGYPSIRLSAYFSPMKLVLFDIDGTLLWTDGAGRRAIRQALLDEVGTAGAIESYRLDGTNDPPIGREVLPLWAPPPAPER